MWRVIIDYYSQGHWIKLLSFPRDKLRGAGCFPVGLSETFYAAFSKNYQERIGRRNVRSQRPADSETAIPSKHSQNLDMQKTQMRRGAWARFSGTRGCGFKTGDAGAYHVGFTLGISGCETFFTCDMRARLHRLWRGVQVGRGWTQASAQTPSTGFSPSSSSSVADRARRQALTLLCARLLLASAGRFHTNGMASRPAGRGPSS